VGGGCHNFSVYG